eukprot:724332-Pleurochrysis_carterae.AAC.1
MRLVASHAMGHIPISPYSPPACLLACLTELLRNEFYLVMLDQTKIGDLKGEVSKDLYPNVPNYGELPDRMVFKFEAWVSKKDKK